MKKGIVLAIVFLFNTNLAFSVDSGWSFLSYPAEIYDQNYSNQSRIPIAIDMEKAVWIVDGSQNIWSYFNDSWQKYPKEVTGLLDRWSIFVDSQNRKWFVSCNTLKTGVVRFDGITWKTFNLSPLNYCREIAEDYDGVMWCTGEGGIGRINPDDTWQVYLNKEIGVNPVTFYAVGVDTNNVKWFSYGERIYWRGGW